MGASSNIASRVPAKNISASPEKASSPGHKASCACYCGSSCRIAAAARALSEDYPRQAARARFRTFQACPKDLPRGVGDRLTVRRTDCEGEALVSGMRRREFVILLGGGAAAAWPLAARAQQSGGIRHIGVLMGLAEDDPEGRLRLAALGRALRHLGWIEGHNIRTDYRWAAGDIEFTHILA